MIVARQLRRTYGEAGVRDIDLEVADGEVLGLVGPNGGGKWLLVLLLAGLVEPESGEVLLEGRPVHELAQASAGAVGLITAEPGLYPLMTGWENLEFFGGLYGLSAEAVRERSASLVTSLRLEGLERRVATASSGMKQKISLLRALLMEPRVLLLDEPTANLDPLSAQVIWSTVREAADRGLTVVLATHDLAAAEQICNRVAYVDGGIGAIRTLPAPRAPEPSPLLELFS